MVLHLRGLADFFSEYGIYLAGQLGFGDIRSFRLAYVIDYAGLDRSGSAQAMEVYIFVLHLSCDFEMYALCLWISCTQKCAIKT